MAKKEKSSESKTKKIKITCHNATGKYLLGYSEGDVAEMEIKQAEEMIEAGDAKEV